MQTEGLNHADSLRQLPFPGNCLNWVIGHLIVSRDGAVEILGGERLWTEETTTRYARESGPITSDDDPAVLRFEKLMEDYETVHTRLKALLAAKTVEDMAAPAPFGDRTLGEFLAFLTFHDSYHTGQTEYLRALAGRHEKVI